MGDDDDDAPVVGGMILQNVELAQHGVVHKVHLTLNLVIVDVDDDVFLLPFTTFYENQFV